VEILVIGIGFPWMLRLKSAANWNDGSHALLGRLTLTVRPSDMRFHLHLLYDNHSAVDVEGQEFLDACEAREEATIALMELWVNHGAADNKAPSAIAVANANSSTVTLINFNLIKTTFHLHA
jgi:hypothetical protein